MTFHFQQITQQDFNKHINTKFIMHPEEHGPVKLELIEVCDKSNSQLDSFSLSFLAATHLVFPQSIFKLSHDVLGEMNLFLVPYNKDAKGVYYHAVFSRFKN